MPAQFFKELMTSLRRAESAISLLGLASLLSITVKLAQADFVNVIPALLDVRAWWLTRALMNSLHSKFVAVTETEGSDISALLHAVGRGRPGMTLTKQFDGLKTAGQITTVGKVIAMLPVAAALLGLTAAGVLAPVLRPLQPLLGKIEGSAVYSRVLDVLLVVKRVANTFWGVNF